jgi:5-methylthioribose kinase
MSTSFGTCFYPQWQRVRGLRVPVSYRDVFGTLRLTGGPTVFMPTPTCKSACQAKGLDEVVRQAQAFATLLMVSRKLGLAHVVGAEQLPLVVRRSFRSQLLSKLGHHGGHWIIGTKRRKPALACAYL